MTLRARRVGSAGEAIEIAVIDTGVGIAADQQALVFEEFRQASGDYLRKAEGTGLGLALAKRFVELHGGTIRLESAPGQGLDVCVYASAAHLGGCIVSTILIVEDNEKNMKLVRDILQHKGHRTLEAVNGLGRRAPGRRAQARPGADGHPAARHRRHRPRCAGSAKTTPWTRSPCSPCQRSVMPDEQQKIVTSGFDAYITKPISLKAFLETVQRFLTDGRKRP